VAGDGSPVSCAMTVRFVPTPVQRAFLRECLRPRGAFGPGPSSQTEPASMPLGQWEQVRALLVASPAEPPDGPVRRPGSLESYRPDEIPYLMAWRWTVHPRSIDLVKAMLREPLSPSLQAGDEDAPGISLEN
jgi:hypothetical protein